MSYHLIHSNTYNQPPERSYSQGEIAKSLLSLEGIFLARGETKSRELSVSQTLQVVVNALAVNHYLEQLCAQRSEQYSNEYSLLHSKFAYHIPAAAKAIFKDPATFAERNNLIVELCFVFTCLYKNFSTALPKDILVSLIGQAELEGRLEDAGTSESEKIIITFGMVDALLRHLEDLHWDEEQYEEFVEYHTHTLELLEEVRSVARIDRIGKEELSNDSKYLAEGWLERKIDLALVDMNTYWPEDWDSVLAEELDELYALRAELGVKEANVNQRYFHMLQHAFALITLGTKPERALEKARDAAQYYQDWVHPMCYQTQAEVAHCLLEYRLAECSVVAALITTNELEAASEKLEEIELWLDGGLEDMISLVSNEREKAQLSARRERLRLILQTLQNNLPKDFQ